MSVRSLGAAASGIDTMQTDLDTIGNDIANSETDGFKSGTAEFQDLLTEQLQPAGAAAGTSLASTNPSAVGAGAEVSAIATDFSEGPVTQTGVSSDVAIEGNGFLVVSQNGQTFYTRDGDLQIDANGNLATQGGGLVLGWASGQPTTSPPGPLSIIVGSAEAPAETQNVDLGGNLPAGSTTPVNVTTTMYDALGKEPGWSRVYAITSRYFHLLGPAHGGPPHALEAGFTFMQPRGSGMLHMTSIQSLRLQRAYLDVSGARWLLFDKSDPVSHAKILEEQLAAYRRIFPVQIENEDVVVFRNDRASPFVRGMTRGCIAFGDSRALPKVALELALRGYALVHADGEELTDVPPEALAAYDCIYTTHETFIEGTLPPAIAARVAFHDDPKLELPPPNGDADPFTLGAIERPRNGQIRVNVTAQRRAMAIVSESYYPYWRATVDGAPVTLFRLQYGLMGMPLAPGPHVIELVYERPVVYALAGWLSALTLLGALASVWRRTKLLRDIDVSGSK